MAALLIMNLPRQDPSFIPEATEEQIQTFLDRKDMIVCCAFSAKINKKHCAENHLKAIENAKKGSLATLSNYRKP